MKYFVKSKSRSVITVTFSLAAVVAAGCGAGRVATIEKRPVTGRPLSALEQWIVMRDEQDVPMDVVQNDTVEGNKLLRTVSTKANPADPVTMHLASRMLATVEKEKGVGIAAPQVGINIRMIWVKRLDKGLERPWELYFNPSISEFSKEKIEGFEGCLSIPAGFGKVERASWVLVEYDTPGGKHVEEKVEGFTARIFQHEIDHLDGILFIDRRPKDAPPLIPKEEYRSLHSNPNVSR